MKICDNNYDNPVFYFYTNFLAPYMFHRWKLMCDAYPGSVVILIQKPDPNRPWPYKASDMEFPCLEAYETFSWSNHFAWSKDLYKIVKSSKNKHVVHLIECVSGLNALTIKNSAQNNPLILVNDGGFPEDTHRPSQKLRWYLIGSHCHGALTPGRAGNLYTKSWGFPEDTIYNSFLSTDVEDFAKYRRSSLSITERKAVRAEYNVKDKDVLVLCNSRLLDWKRIEDLAESLLLMQEKVKEKLFLVLIGDGPYKIPLKMLNNQKAVRFQWIPSVRYEHIKKYYSAADIFVLPSEGDIWGLVINEALSMGKPVICTNRVGASELVVDNWNGFKVAIRDPFAISEALEKLVLNEPLRKELSNNAINIEHTWHSGKFINELHRIVANIRHIKM